MKFRKDKTSCGRIALLLAATVVMLVTIPVVAFGNTMIHNSTTLGSTKWGGNWGTATGQYGEFKCGTCHVKGSTNIKRVRTAIDSPNGVDAWPNGSTTTGTITFTTTDEGTYPAGTGFGDDAGGHATSVRICESCHSQNKYHNYDTSAAAQTSTNHYNDADCTSCHKHGNGFAPSACNACHNASSALADSHGAHYNTATVASTISASNDSTSGNYIFQCGNCHSATAHNGGNVSIDQAAEVSFAGIGTYTAGPLAGTDIGAGGSFNYTSGSCNANDCHNDGTAAKGAPNSNPTWTGALAADCTGCHDNNKAAAQTMASNAHGAHINGGATYMDDKSCNTCHNVTVDGTDRAIADKTQHVNGTRNVDIAATYDSNGTPGDNFASSACTNVYCHSDGKTSGVTYKSINWTTGSISDCVSCHEGASVGTTLSGAHEAHVVNAVATIGQTLGCVDCHSATVSNNTTISTAANHVNKTVNVADCSTNICHSNGNFGANLVQYNPTFATDTLGCFNCHGDNVSKSHPTYANGGPADDSSNSHVAHVETSLISCEECHADTSKTGTSIDGATPAQHVDGGIDVVFKQTGSYVDGTDTCSTTYCHGAGTPVWGGGAQACNSCHNASNALADSHGSHYESATVATAINANNDSVTGTYVFQCGNCHNSTSHAGGAVTAEQAAEVSLAGSGTYTPNAGVSAGTDNGFSYTAGSCDTNDCHNDGTAAKGAPNGNPTWGTALAADCTGCHDNNKAAAQTMASNAHGAHINGGATYMDDKACNTCHNVTVDGTDRAIADKAQHINGTQNVDIIAALDSDATPGNNFAANACNNVYCHSDGKTSGVTYKSINWTTGSISDCVSCHDGAVVGTGLSGAHAEHFNGATLQTIGKALGCADCHSATVSNNTTISTAANHVNKTVNVADCSTNVCHSNGNFGANLVQYNPTFATDTLGCFNCHGDNVSKSHPTYANGGPADDSSNSHVAHVETSLISCEECHADTSKTGTSIDGATPAQHVDGGIDVVFKQAGSYVDGTDTCSTTYCHGSGTPVWGGAAQACDSCHSASSALADSHGVHYNSATVATAINANNNSTAGNYVFQCGSCHNGTSHAGGAVSTGIQAAEVSLAGTGTYTATGTSAGTDRGFDYTAGSCNTNDCHNDGTAAKGAPNSNPTWTGALAADCTGCHDNNKAAAQTMASNAHGAHINDGTIMTDKSCNTCHNVTVDGTDRAIADKTRHINGTRDINIIAALDGGNTFASNSCDAVYCHSDGKATAAYATVGWSTTISTCTACHGGAGGSNGGAATPLSTSHTIHTGTNGTTQFAYTCDDCHSATASNNTTIGTAANHVNQNRDVSVLAANGGTGTIGGDFSGGSCATTNCHGSASPIWTAGGTTGDCSLCHGMAASTADGRDTNGDTVNTDAQVGAHVAHLTAASGISAPITCDQCHVNPNATAGSYMAKVNSAGHMDGTALLTWGGIANGNDDGQATPAPVSCATTYCHDASKIKNAWGGAEVYTLDWATPKMTGTSADCNNCHGYPPAGSHVANSDCSVCHDVLNADDVTFTAAGKLTHIDGVVQASGGNSCIDCHGADIDNALNGAHARHTDTATFLALKTISGGDNGGTGWYTTTYVNGKPNFGCGECHPGEGIGHPANGLNIDLDPAGETPTAGSLKLKNVDGPINPTFTSRGSVTCNNVYCHSDAGATPAYVTSPNWYGGAVSGNCNDCHANGPASGTHANHLVGIHYETLYDGASNLMAKSGTTGTGAAHGDAATSDPISCQTCHNSTVAVEYNSTNSVCTTCHTGSTGSPVTGDEKMIINTAGSTHVNGLADVVFANLSTFKSKAQVRDDITTVASLDANWARNGAYKTAAGFDQVKVATPSYAGGSCSNVSCHNGINTPTWSTGFVGDCRACHTSLP